MALAVLAGAGALVIQAGLVSLVHADLGGCGFGGAAGAGAGAAVGAEAVGAAAVGAAAVGAAAVGVAAGAEAAVEAASATDGASGLVPAPLLPSALVKVAGPAGAGAVAPADVPWAVLLLASALVEETKLGGSAGMRTGLCGGEVCVEPSIEGEESTERSLALASPAAVALLPAWLPVLVVTVRVAARAGEAVAVAVA